MKKKLKNLLPLIIVKILKKLRTHYKRTALKLKKNIGKVYTEKDILNGLRENGIKEGDSLLVHCRMSSIGYVEGGENSIISALCKAVNAPSEGTILMPTFPMNQMSEYYFADNPVFDVINTPSSMGKVSEQFRKMPGVKRSLHPSHSISAFGRNTNYFLDDHFRQMYPFNVNSPFYKLSEIEGKIILIGLKMGEALTNLHVIEDTIKNYNISVYKKNIYTARLIDYEGKEHKVPLKIHDSNTSKKRKCDDLEHFFNDDKIMKKGKIGDAYCMIFNAKKLNNRMIELYNEGITIYNPTPSVNNHN